jgi:hypothetical protein
LSGVAAACDCGSNECKSPGYWKNHPEAWPGKCITIGSTTYYKCPAGGQLSYQDAIDIMQQPVKGDKTYTMFDALVAAKLNELNGCPSCKIIDTITGADRWMGKYGSVGSGVKASSDEWQKSWQYTCKCGYPSGEALYLKLDAYNNGKL